MSALQDGLGHDLSVTDTHTHTRTNVPLNTHTFRSSSRLIFGVIPRYGLPTLWDQLDLTNHVQTFMMGSSRGRIFMASFYFVNKNYRSLLIEVVLFGIKCRGILRNLQLLLQRSSRNYNLVKCFSCGCHGGGRRFRVIFSHDRNQMYFTNNVLWYSHSFVISCKF